MAGYQSIYKVNTIQKQTNQLKTPPLKTLPKRKLSDRFETKSKVVTPAPNRYAVKTGTDIADFVNKRVGSKGPYSCFSVARDYSTIISHSSATMRDKNCTATPDFEAQRAVKRPLKPINYLISKIGHGWGFLSKSSQIHIFLFILGSRYEEKPNMRCILSGDPQHPGPAQYYPQNHCIKKLAYHKHP